MLAFSCVQTGPVQRPAQRLKESTQRSHATCTPWGSSDSPGHPFPVLSWACDEPVFCLCSAHFSLGFPCEFYNFGDHLLGQADLVPSPGRDRAGKRHWSGSHGLVLMLASPITGHVTMPEQFRGCAVPLSVRRWRAMKALQEISSKMR